MSIVTGMSTSINVNENGGSTCDGITLRAGTGAGMCADVSPSGGLYTSLGTIANTSTNTVLCTNESVEWNIGGSISAGTEGGTWAGSSVGAILCIVTAVSIHLLCLSLLSSKSPARSLTRASLARNLSVLCDGGLRAVFKHPRDTFRFNYGCIAARRL